MDPRKIGIASLLVAYAFVRYTDADPWLGRFLWLVVSGLLYFSVMFVQNLHYARRSGFPKIICPWDQQSLTWIIIGPLVEPFMKSYFPAYIYNRLILTVYGWDFRHREHPFGQIAARQGDDQNFMLVSCGGPEFWSRDPEIATQVLGRPNDFCPQALAVLFMSKFGHNVLTAHGDDWVRQRKVVAKVINDRVSNTVFEETIRQTEGLVADLFPPDSTESEVAVTNKLFDNMKKITSHVLSGAGMGATVPWKDESEEKPRPGFRFSYIQACKIVLNALAGPIIFPQWLLSHYPFFLPGSKFMHELGHAVKEFPVHTRYLLEQERERSISMPNETAKNNILSQLLHASNKTGQQALSEEETVGNLFFFTAAGFDTTATTLSYGLVLLARYPEWQEWLFQEIRTLASGAEQDNATLDYHDIFPKAQRTLAFMLEVLRHFPPIIDISRQTKDEQTLTTSKGTYWFPAQSTIYLSLPNIHINAEVFRNLNIHTARGEQATDHDEHGFRPSRWIEPLNGAMWQPPKGTYAPWSLGSRMCPGQKMAQVEFIAVLVILLSRYEIEAVAIDGEERTETEERLDSLMKNSVNIFTLQMVNIYEPKTDDEGLKLRLRRRK